MLLITLLLLDVNPNVSCGVTSEHYFKLDFPRNPYELWYNGGKIRNSEYL